MASLSANNPAASALSPCRQICVLDEQSGLCRGCARSRDEIALWSQWDELQRRAIMAQLPDRRRALGWPDEPSKTP